MIERRFSYAYTNHQRSGCVAAHSQVFSSLGTRCLVITGAHSAKNSGALDDCLKALESQGIAYEIFDKVMQNPQITVCEEAGKLAKTFGAQFLVGIGGGSPLDATKAIAAFASNDIHGEEIYDGVKNDLLPFILIGTTAGTGSEVTQYSVLTKEDGRKKSFKHATSFARYAFCDPTYTHSLSYGFSVSTALDALTHCLESYFAKGATLFSEQFALRGAQLLFEGLGVLAQDPQAPITPEVREKLYYGSLFGGMAICQTGTGFCHPLGYFLTEEYHVPHGQACAVYLADYVEEGRLHEPQRYERLWKSCDFTPEAFLRLLDQLVDVKLPSLTHAQLEEIAHRTSTSGNFKVSPGVFDEAKALKLLEKIFG